jgi:hypothetical protein
MTTVSGFSWIDKRLRGRRLRRRRRNICWISWIVGWVVWILWVIVPKRWPVMRVRTVACWRRLRRKIVMLRIVCASRSVRRRRAIAVVAFISSVVIVRRCLFTACVLLACGLQPRIRKPTDLSSSTSSRGF